MNRLLPALMPLVMIAACLGSDFADSVRGSWVLQSGTLDGENIEFTATHPVTLDLEEDNISGTAACNAYGGQYRITASQFEIVEGLAVTEMGCMPEAIMTTERRYLDALVAVDTIYLDDGKLMLSGPRSQLLLSAADESEDTETGS